MHDLWKLADDYNVYVFIAKNIQMGRALESALQKDFTRRAELTPLFFYKGLSRKACNTALLRASRAFFSLPRTLLSSSRSDRMTTGAKTST